MFKLYCDDANAHTHGNTCCLYRALKIEDQLILRSHAKSIFLHAKSNESLHGQTDKGKSTRRPRKLNTKARTFIEDQMRKEDETTSSQIQKKPAKRGIQVHPSTV